MAHFIPQPLPYIVRGDQASTVDRRRRLIVAGGLKHEDDETDNKDSFASVHTHCFEVDLNRGWNHPDLNVPRTGAVAFLIPQKKQAANEIMDYDGDYVVVAAGKNSTGPITSVETYDAENHKWDLSSAVMPDPRWMAACVSIHQERAALIVGGRDKKGRIYKTAVLCDSDLEFMLLKPELREGRVGPGIVVLPRQRVLVVGGYNGSTWLRSCELYDYSQGGLMDGKWMYLEAKMPIALRYPRAVYVEHEKRGYILVVGAMDEGRSSMICFDFAMGKWILGMDNIERPQMDGAIFVVLGKKLCIVQNGPGMHGNGGHVKTITMDKSFFLNFTDPFVSSSTSLKGSVIYGAEGLPKLDDEEILFKGRPCKYSGQTHADRQTTPHGVGRVSFTQGKATGGVSDSFYIGTFKDGSDDGLGEICLPAQNWSYVGEFREGLFSGFGFFKNQNIEYFGGFEKGVMAGVGRCTILRDGQKLVYTGEWKKDRADGRGTVLEHGSGKILFVGKWEDGLAKDSAGQHLDYYTGEVRKKNKFEKKHFIGYL